MSFISGDGGRTFHYFDNTLGDRSRVTRVTAAVVSVYCYRAIQYRAQNIAEPTLGVLEEAEEGEAFLDRHPLLDTFAEPNLDQSMAEIVEATQMWWDIDGRALWLFRRQNGLIREIQAFSGREIEEILPGPDRLYGTFKVNVDGRVTPFPADRVCFFRFPHPNSRTEGLSPTDLALEYLNLEHEVRTAIKNYLRNAMFPGGVISAHQDWDPSDKEYEKWQSRIEEFYAGGARTAGKPFVNTGGMKFNQTALPFRDLLPEELLDRIESVVASAYGIQPVVMGWLVGLKNSPWSQIKEARRMTYEDTLQPVWRRWRYATSRQMLDKAERMRRRAVAFDLRGIAALQVDDQTRATIQQANREVWTVGERRAYTGLEPFGDDKDNVVAGQGQPVDEESDDGGENSDEDHGDDENDGESGD